MDIHYFSNALKKNSILNGRYIIQDVLSQDAFEITYLAKDYQTGSFVLIKEYCPEGIVYRTAALALLPVNNLVENNFLSGKRSFLREGKKLAGLDRNPNIVSIFGGFEENNTAYLTMEYIQGKTLSVYVREKGGRLHWGDALTLLLPVMEVLTSFHAKGILHRNITPDNIIVTPEERAMLLDFGAARYYTGARSQSLDLILNHGFAPYEQYLANGNQGPWTDVYSMAAALYKVITGITPPDAPDRFVGPDPLKRPSQTGADVSGGYEEILLKALSTAAEERFQSMEDFIRSLQSGRIEVSQKAEDIIIINFEDDEEDDGGIGLTIDRGQGGIGGFGGTFGLDSDDSGRTFGPGTDDSGRTIRHGSDGFGETDGGRSEGSGETDGNKLFKWIKKKKILFAIAGAAILGICVAAIWPFPTPVEYGGQLKEDVFEKMVDNKYDLESAKEYGVFGSGYKRSDIIAVTFLTSTKDESDNSWDVSADHDKSVRAWTEEEGGYHHLYIASKGGMTAPENLQGMFEGYVNLQAIEWNDAINMQNVKNMKTLFYGCEKLEKLDLTPFQTAEPETLRFMLDSCKSLISLDVSCLNTSSVKDMAGLFYGCSGIRELDLSGFDTSNVEDIKSMFCDCSALEKIEFGSGFNTEKVRIFSFMFSDCTSLASLDTTVLDLGNAEKTMSMFEGCSSLKDLDTSHFDFSKVGSADKMFSNCSSLETLTFSNPVCLADSMFAGCTNLKQVDFKGSLLSAGKEAFKDCDLTLNYPADDERWKAIAGNSYGGTVEWVSSDGTVQVGLPGTSDQLLIPDPALRQAIQENLKISGRGVTLEDAAELIELIVSGEDKSEEEQIHDLTGLEYFENLEMLKINYGQIEDLTPIKDLTKLRELSFYRNKVSDLSPLQELKDLKVLYLGYNEVTDISPLKELTGLSILWLCGNKVTDIEVLHNFVQLTNLHLCENEVKDFSHLQTLTHLKELSLYKCGVTDLSIIKNMTELTKLDLHDNQIEDLTLLSAMTDLTELNLTGNLIKDISPLEQLVNLTTLKMAGNQIEDISSLKGMKAIEILDLSNNFITDISPLKDMEKLTELNIEKNPIGDYSPLDKLPESVNIKK